MRILFWIVAVPLLAVAGAFAAANHDPLTLRLWPLPYEVVVPVYGAVLGAFGLGVLLTALWFWIAGLPGRFERMRRARHERRLEEETARLRAELAEYGRDGAPSEARGDHPARRLITSGTE